MRKSTPPSKCRKNDSHDEKMTESEIDEMKNAEIETPCYHVTILTVGNFYSTSFYPMETV